MTKKRQHKLRSEREYFSVINVINKDAHIYWKCPGLEKFERNLQNEAKRIIRTGVQLNDDMKLRLRLCRRTY